MEIALLVFLFLVGSVAGAMQALKYLEQRGRGRRKTDGTPPPPPSDSHH